MPCFTASPERGRTCPSKPRSIATARPVGTSARAPGASVMGASSAAARSRPAAPSVMYLGRIASGRRRVMRSFTNGASRTEIVHVLRRLPKGFLARESDLPLAVDRDDLDQELV